MKGTIEFIWVNFFVLDKGLFLNFFLEIFKAEKVIINTVLLFTTRKARGSRNGKAKGSFCFNKACTKVDLPLPEGADTTMSFPSFNYSTFINCSFIFSSSSFIWMTSFCKPAWLAFDPIVLISLPIS